MLCMLSDRVEVKVSVYQTRFHPLMLEWGGYVEDWGRFHGKSDGEVAGTRGGVRAERKGINEGESCRSDRVGTCLG